MDDIFRITKDANGQPVYTHNNEVLSKNVFDQRKEQSSAEQREIMKPTAFDSELDDMRARAEALRASIAAKKATPKAKGGNVKSSLNPKRRIHPNW